MPDELKFVWTLDHQIKKIHFVRRCSRMPSRRNIFWQRVQAANGTVREVFSMESSLLGVCSLESWKLYDFILKSLWQKNHFILILWHNALPNKICCFRIVHYKAMHALNSGLNKYYFLWKPSNVRAYSLGISSYGIMSN